MNGMNGMTHAPMGGPPSTMPRPPRWSDLTAEEQEALLNQGWTVMQDGTLSPPSGGGMDMGMGMGPPPATAPPDMGMEAASDPFAAPQFERFFRTANAPFPGTPGGVGGGPLPDEGNPMGDALPDPFETPEVAKPLQVQKASPPPHTGFAGDATKKSPPQMPGRVGRSVARRSSRPMQNHRRRT